MASISSSPTSLEDLVSCSICLENFTDPRALPCVHSYCRGCLERLVTPQGKITCPQCRMEFEVPDKDVSNFTPNFIVNNLLELSSLNTVIPSGSPDEQANSTTQCSTHTGRKCELYCDDCSKWICYQCIAKWADCHQHKYRDASEVVGHFRQVLEDLNHKGEQRLPAIKQHLAVLEDFRAKQTANVGEICEKIEETFAQHLRTLQIRKTQLVQAAIAAHEKNVGGMESEFERIQIEQAKAASTNELCRKMLNIEDPVVFMNNYSEIEAKVSEIALSELVSELDIHEIKFEEDDALLQSVLLSYGSVQNVRPGDEAKQSKAIGKEAFVHVQNVNGKPGNRESSGTIPGTSGSPPREERPSSSPPNRAENVPTTRSVSRPVNNTPVYWKLYPKRFTDKWITIEQKGLRVLSQNSNSVSVIGYPGFWSGKHSWKVKGENLRGGLGVGVCLCKDNPAFCVMYDCPFSRLASTVVLSVELDCETGTMKVTPQGHPTKLLQYCERNVWVNPYFVLPPNGGGSLTVVDMDGKAVEENSSCNIL